MSENKAKQPNGDRTDAGAPRTGSHETVITMREAGFKTCEVAKVTRYTERRIQQIWSAFQKRRKVAPASEPSAGRSDSPTEQGQDTTESKRAS